MKIGVFDSGIGGKSIAERLERDFPIHEVLYASDREHVPYGSRETQEIIELTDAAIQPLLQAGCEVIVLACNTATAAAIEFLREKYPETPFVGLEPMVKPAAILTKSGVVAICATPATLGSERYQRLKDAYAQDISVLEPDCSNWAYMIEHSEVQLEHISNIVESVIEEGADVIVLACTHYHWIKDQIFDIADGRAKVLDPSEAISRRVDDILSQKRRKPQPEVV